VRIAPRFGLEFPFDQYQEIDQLPVIEVEFNHLKEADDHAVNLFYLILQDQMKQDKHIYAQCCKIN
jgi:hypothetical protein